MLPELFESTRLARCPVQECTDEQLGKFSLKLGSVWTHRTQLKGVTGIDGATSVTDCKKEFTAFKDFKDDPWPYYPKFAPLLVKSHYPEKGHEEPEVDKFTRQVTRVIHIVRNPFDNLASQFMGNQGKNQQRYQRLLEKRSEGGTTKAFADFLKMATKRFAYYHNYWYSRQEEDAKRGVPTIWVRYETMCAETAPVIEALVSFSGFYAMTAAKECTLSA